MSETDAAGRTIITLDSTERVGDAVRRIAQASGPVALVIGRPPQPPVNGRQRTGMLWSEADFEWLARRAADLDRPVAIVAADAATRRAARAVGLPSYRRLDIALGGGWARGASLRWPTRARERLDEIRVRPPWPTIAMRRATAPRWFTRLAVALLTLVAGVALGGMALLLAPTAEIVVRPAGQAFGTTLDIVVVGGTPVAGAGGVAAGRVVDAIVEARVKVEPGGAREEPSERATGFVQALNRRSEPVTLPAGVVVETTSGARVRFRTTEAVELPGEVGATTQIPIVALEPGTGGNVAAYAINGIEPTWARSVGVVNDGPTSGGSVRASPVITETDRDEARLQLEARLRDDALAALRAQVAPGERLAGETFFTELLAEGFDVEPARRLQGSLSLRLHGRALVYDPQQVEAAAQRVLEERTPLGWRLVAERTRLEVAERPRQTLTEPLGVIVPVRAEAEAEALVDRNALRNLVRGMTPTEATRAVAALGPLAEPPWVSLGPRWPDWLPARWRRLPLLPLRIQVTVLEYRP